MIRFEFKEDAVEVVSSDPWYDIAWGGYIKPEDLLVKEEQVLKIKEAVETLKAFFEQMEEAELFIAE